MNMICKIHTEKGGGFCESRSILDALDYAVDTGLLRNSIILEWIRALEEKDESRG